MRVSLHAGAERFLAAARHFLDDDPFSTNVISVIANRILADQQLEVDSHLWATVEDEDGLVLGVAMQTPPHPLFLSRMSAAAATALAGLLSDANRDLPGVSGAAEVTAAFSAGWSARTGRTSRVVTAMRMYRLGDLAPPVNVPGTAAVAQRPGDVQLVAAWCAAFHDEAQAHAPVEDWVAFAERRVGVGQIHLWTDGGGPVAMAGVSAPAAGVARVGPVYTPLAARRRGYGAAVTAVATAAALASGAEHVTLYTDLANPTANSIYRSIGYRPDHDAEERLFE